LCRPRTCRAPPGPAGQLPEGHDLEDVSTPSALALAEPRNCDVERYFRSSKEARSPLLHAAPASDFMPRTWAEPMLPRGLRQRPLLLRFFCPPARFPPALLLSFSRPWRILPTQIVVAPPALGPRPFPDGRSFHAFSSLRSRGIVELARPLFSPVDAGGDLADRLRRAHRCARPQSCAPLSGTFNCEHASLALSFPLLLSLFLLPLLDTRHREMNYPFPSPARFFVCFPRTVLFGCFNLVF